MRIKTRICEVYIYLHPQIEQVVPQMYFKEWNCESVFITPTFVNYVIKHESQKLKNEYLNTVPSISLLICNHAKDSICANENEETKSIA